jgi:hypothetical protein
MILSDTVLDVIRRELRKISPNVKIDIEQIREVLLQEVLKRDVVEGEKADEARRKIARATRPSKKPTKEPFSQNWCEGERERINKCRQSSQFSLRKFQALTT